MKMEIRERINHVRSLWERQEGCSSVVQKNCVNNGFFVRHHSFARPDSREKGWFSEYTDEKYNSAFDCLAYYRWYVIPEKLREVSGLWEETDLELLLDNAGYSVSFIAEELFCMIDACLESGSCSEEDLDRIRLAYNGLSGFQDDFIQRIAQWGSTTDRGISKFSINTQVASIS